MTVRKVGLVLALVAGLFVGCGDDDDGGQATDTTQGNVEQAAEDVQEGVKDAASEAADTLRTGWASLESNAERLVDEIQTRDDPQAKQELLDECRNRLQDARKANSDQAGRIEALCDRIRDTDVASDGWGEIHQEIKDIDVG